MTGAKRFKLVLEYDGGPFVGWQRQENGPSVQGALEDAAFRLCALPCSTVAAGRTDAGVHALAMTAHIDLPARFDADTVRDALNFHLKPLPVAVLDAREAPAGFHARFSAKARRYLYRIANRRAPLALDAGRAWRIGQRLDEGRMAAAGDTLTGCHDFSTFRAVHCQSASPVKTLTSLVVARSEDRIDISVAAPSFLHHQVRSIVGTLCEVGLGRWRTEDVKTALEARDRARCGPVAPPDGLYFVAADYETS
ncbi:MAG: tRNA pseudouridine(38-40) synthase TruA [Parvularculaceae bacterium]